MPSDKGLFALDELIRINLPSMYMLTKLLCDILANQPRGITEKLSKSLPLTQNLGEELYEGMSDETLDGFICWARTVVASASHKAARIVPHERKRAIVGYACNRVFVHNVDSLSCSGIVPPTSQRVKRESEDSRKDEWREAGFRTTREGVKRVSTQAFVSRFTESW